MAVVDLHLHTTASDGRLTPTELINLVAKKGLRVVAVTDHDSTEGLDEAVDAAKEEEPQDDEQYDALREFNAQWRSQIEQKARMERETQNGLREEAAQEVKKM